LAFAEYGQKKLTSLVNAIFGTLQSAFHPYCYRLPGHAAPLKGGWYREQNFKAKFYISNKTPHQQIDVAYCAIFS
jgi:hypothetical protein